MKLRITLIILTLLLIVGFVAIQKINMMPIWKGNRFSIKYGYFLERNDKEYTLVNQDKKVKSTIYNKDLFILNDKSLMRIGNTYDTIDLDNSSVLLISLPDQITIVDCSNWKTTRIGK